MTEEKLINLALKQAKIAYNKDEVPVGAVIMLNNKIIAKAHNLRETNKLATAHAEILAINKACKKIKDFRLENCVMAVTLEPCLMCIGAIINARIKKLIYGASISKPETIKIEELVKRAGLNHNLEICKFDKNNECKKLLTDYFAEKRIKNTQK